MKPVDYLIAEYLSLLEQTCSSFPKAEEGYDRRYAMEFLDYGTIKMTKEEVDDVIKLLEDNPSEDHSKAISIYFAETFVDQLNAIVVDFAKIQMRETLKKVPLFKSRQFQRDIQLLNLTHKYISDNFTVDLDALYVIRAIIEYLNPYGVVSRKVQKKTDNGWEDLTSTVQYLMDENCFNTFITKIDSSSLYTSFGGLDKTILTDEKEGIRVVYEHSDDLSDVYANGKWLGLVITDPDFLFLN